MVIAYVDVERLDCSYLVVDYHQIDDDCNEMMNHFQNHYQTYSDDDNVDVPVVDAAAVVVAVGLLVGSKIHLVNVVILVPNNLKLIIILFHVHVFINAN